MVCHMLIKVTACSYCFKNCFMLNLVASSMSLQFLILQMALFHRCLILHSLLRAAHLQSSTPLSWMREDVSSDMVRILHTKT